MKRTRASSMRAVLVIGLILAVAWACAAGELEGRRMTAREMNAAAGWLEEVGCYDLEFVATMDAAGFSFETTLAHRALGDAFGDSRFVVMGMVIEMLCAGDSLWTVSHALKTYSVEPWRGVNAPGQGSFGGAGGFVNPFAFDFIVDMLAPPAPPGKEDLFYTFVGDDSVTVAGQHIPCEMWTFAADSSEASRIWLDPVRHIVLKGESMVRDPIRGVMSTSMTVTRLEVDNGLTPESFAFVAPEGYRRVAAPSKLLVKDSIEGQTLPDVALTDVAGAEISTREWRGRIVVLEYWGVHCPPCRKELEHLAALRAEFGEDVAFAAVTDDRGPQVERFVHQNQITLPVYLDPKAELRAAYHVSNTPTLFVLDATGAVREHFVGLQSAETLREALLRAGATSIKPNGH